MPFPVVFNHNNLSPFPFFPNKNHFSLSNCNNRGSNWTGNINTLMRSKSEIPTSEIGSSPHYRIHLCIRKQLLIFQIVRLQNAWQFNFTTLISLITKSTLYFCHGIGPCKSRYSKSQKPKRPNPTKSLSHDIKKELKKLTQRKSIRFQREKTRTERFYSCPS